MRRIPIISEDSWEEFTPSEIALAAAWPLMKNEQHTVHHDECDIFDGDECDCVPWRVSGPTGFA